MLTIKTVNVFAWSWSFLSRWYCIQTLTRNSLHGPLNCEIGGLNCHISITQYRTRVHCIHI